MKDLMEGIDNANEPLEVTAKRIAKRFPGEKINAIKALRAETGVGLKEAHDAIKVLYPSSVLPHDPDRYNIREDKPITDELVDEISMRNPGETINAIKELRQETGCSLRDATDLMRKSHGRPPIKWRDITKTGPIFLEDN